MVILNPFGYNKKRSKKKKNNLITFQYKIGRFLVFWHVPNIESWSES